MDSKLAVGKVIKMPCMRSGVCEYPKEKILVTKAALDFLKASAIGIPVVMDHPTEKITDESIKTMQVVGRVADLHYIESEELWYAHFVIDTAEAVKCLEEGYGVSTAWYGIKYGEGGTYNNVAYDRELIEGRYEHLAIVMTPRYEMAVNPVFMNSKGGQNKPSGDNINTDKSKRSISMFGKIFRKTTNREEIMANSNEEMVVEIDGKEMPLKDAIEAAAKNEMPMVNGDSKVDVDGEQVSINELIKAYKSSKAKKNESEEKDEEKDEKKEAKKKNESEEKKEEKDEKKENSSEKTAEQIAEEKRIEDEKVITNSRFNEIDNIHHNGVQNDPSEMLSLNERVNLGKTRYGSGK